MQANMNENLHQHLKITLLNVTLFYQKENGTRIQNFESYTPSHDASWGRCPW